MCSRARYSLPFRGPRVWRAALSAQRRKPISLSALSCDNVQPESSAPVLLPEQALPQSLRFDINELHPVGPVKHAVRNTLLHGSSQNGENGILNTLNVLNVQRCVNVHARFQQFLDVLIALHMAGIVPIRVR